jgi:phospholipid transport system substrate-binding protein
MKRHIRILPFLTLLVWALPAYSSPSPQQLVRDTSTQILTAIQREESAIAQQPDRLYELVSEVVLPHFDFERMGRWVLGKHWRRATPEQQQAFVREFRALLVRTYSNALARYAGEEIVYPPLKVGEQERRVTVPMEVRPPGGMPVQIVYRMYRDHGNWKVYDVAVEGVSLVTNYRTTFSSKIQREGLEQLIRQLAAANKTPGTA